MGDYPEVLIFLAQLLILHTGVSTVKNNFFHICKLKTIPLASVPICMPKGEIFLLRKQKANCLTGKNTGRVITNDRQEKKNNKEHSWNVLFWCNLILNIEIGDSPRAPHRFGLEISQDQKENSKPLRCTKCQFILSSVFQLNFKKEAFH